ncbi:helix-turn-helix transcriptional regulator [Halosegnis marinus]|uniref:Helix-turn-helix transcriptional regulator n=1 Tax=Halosegnis marinus TaxID=3034023 RepID=A0ABD5ZQJ4_9EURY|nr:helix-turn-helix transcriptional regulator [Halosegnis sp. DT85]
MTKRPTSGIADRGTETNGGVTVEQLRNELGSGADGGVRLAPDQEAEAILDDVLSAVGSAGFRFDESTVKGNLEEILLTLVAHREHDSHGKGLMGDLATVFDTRLSPGTVYPRLHDLEEADLLGVQELVRTKEYRVADTEGLRDRVADAMEQHLVLGLFFQAALAELDE